jgi:predicted transcriptional regulator
MVERLFIVLHIQYKVRQLDNEAYFALMPESVRVTMISSIMKGMLNWPKEKLQEK